MRVFLFSPRFHEPVRSGTKCQTVRGRQKRPVHPGDVLSLRAWTGLPYRSKQETLRTALCSNVDPVFLSFGREPLIHVEIAGVILTPAEVARFVRSDGFTDEDDFRNFWLETHGLLPFEGDLIRWGTE